MTCTYIPSLFQLLHEYSGLENFWKRYNKVGRRGGGRGLSSAHTVEGEGLEQCSHS